MKDIIWIHLLNTFGCCILSFILFLKAKSKVRLNCNSNQKSPKTITITNGLFFSFVMFDLVIFDFICLLNVCRSGHKRIIGIGTRVQRRAFHATVVWSRQLLSRECDQIVSLCKSKQSFNVERYLSSVRSIEQKRSK